MLGTEVELGLREIVFDVETAPPPQKIGTSITTQFWPNVYFDPTSIVAKWLDG